MISFFAVLCLLMNNAVSKLQHRVLRSSILHHFPQLKLHHIVVVQEPNRSALYTLDFTPIHQSRVDTLLKLVSGKNVPAEVRLRYIEGGDFMNDTMILEHLQNTCIHAIHEPASAELRNLFDRVMQWEQVMNMYTRNCQHFSYFVETLL